MLKDADCSDSPLSGASRSQAGPVEESTLAPQSFEADLRWLPGNSLPAALAGGSLLVDWSQTPKYQPEPFHLQPLAALEGPADNGSPDHSQPRSLAEILGHEPIALQTTQNDEPGAVSLLLSDPTARQASFEDQAACMSRAGDHEGSEMQELMQIFTAHAEEASQTQQLDADNLDDLSEQENQMAEVKGKTKHRIVKLPDGTERPVTPKEWRRIRRRVTNRNSALRTRMRRQEELACAQSQVDGLRDENSRLKNYISQLEQMHGSMSSELVSWRERFRSSTAKSALLRQQLMDHRQGVCDGMDHTLGMSQMSQPSSPQFNMEGRRLISAQSMASGLSSDTLYSHVTSGLPPCHPMRRHSLAGEKPSRSFDRPPARPIPPYIRPADDIGYPDELQRALESIFQARDTCTQGFDDYSFDKRTSGSLISSASRMRT